MSLDAKVFEEVRQSFQEQGLLLQLGQAWVERTGGKVIPGVQMDAQDYVALLKNSPLYDEVKDCLNDCVSVVSMRQMPRNIPKSLRVKGILLRYLPRGAKILNDFLSDPDYTKKCIAYSWETFLQRYNPATGMCENGFISPGSAIHGLLQFHHITFNNFLRHLGFESRWHEYKKNSGIPKAEKIIAKNILDDFLSYPDRDGTTSYSLKTVLEYYNPKNRNMITPRKYGLGRKAARLISEKKISKDKFLELCGIKEEWDKYEKTPGLSRKYKETAINVLQAFLQNPDYTGTTPYALITVIRYYNPETGEGLKGRIPSIGVNAASAMTEQGMSKDKFLELCGMKEQWEKYENIPGMSRKYKETAREVLQEFLQNPDYIGTTPYSLITVLISYDPETRTILKQGNRGPGRNAASAIIGQGMSEDAFLEICGVKKEWELYQSTPGISRKYKETASVVLQTFLSNPIYNKTKPYKLTSVLSKYNTKTEKMVKQDQHGTGRNIASAISKNEIPNFRFLELCGLRGEWEEYVRNAPSNKSGKHKRRFAS